MPKLEDYTRYVFGESSGSLDPDILPKEIDVLRYIITCYDVSQAETPRMDRKKRIASVVKIVVAAVDKIWEKKSRPTRSHRAKYWLVKKLMEKAEHVKLWKLRHEHDNAFIQEVREEHDKLFDISEKQVEEKLDEPMETEVPEVVVQVLGERKRKAPSWLTENMDYEVILSTINDWIMDIPVASKNLFKYTFLFLQG